MTHIFLEKERDIVFTKEVFLKQKYLDIAKSLMNSHVKFAKT
jgi:hypothetical protein